MTWSYGGNPGANERDQVRFLIQDTDTTDQLLQNEEIDFLLTLEGSALKAAAKAAETIAAKFARWCDESVGKVKVSFSQKYEQYATLSDKLSRDANIKGAMPFAGGLTHSQKDVQEQDSDRVEPYFTRRLHDYTRQPNEDFTGVKEGVQEEEDL